MNGKQLRLLPLYSIPYGRTFCPRRVHRLGAARLAPGGGPNPPGLGPTLPIKTFRYDKLSATPIAIGVKRRSYMQIFIILPDP